MLMNSSDVIIEKEPNKSAKNVSKLSVLKKNIKHK